MRKIVTMMLLAFAPALFGGYFSSEQLDNLLAPVALYPDPLLAQVLLAAAFPNQIDDAARISPDGADIDSQPWDASVKSVAHYPTVLDMMADNLDWTIALGQAYAGQPADVLASVQRLRREARAAGNLESNPEQEVIEVGGYIEIWPVDPQYLFVPEYDPSVVYGEADGFDNGPAVSYGSGFLIGAWLNEDCDWPHHRVGRSRRYVVHATREALSRALPNPAVANRDVTPPAQKARRQQPEPPPPDAPEVSQPAPQAPPDTSNQAVQQSMQREIERALPAQPAPPPAKAEPRDADKKR
jgi:hypothetical protein